MPRSKFDDGWCNKKKYRNGINKYKIVHSHTKHTKHDGEWFIEFYSLPYDMATNSDLKHVYAKVYKNDDLYCGRSPDRTKLVKTGDIVKGVIVIQHRGSNVGKPVLLWCFDDEKFLCPSTGEHSVYKWNRGKLKISHHTPLITNESIAIQTNVKRQEQSKMSTSRKAKKLPSETNIDKPYRVVIRKSKSDDDKLSKASRKRSGNPNTTRNTKDSLKSVTMSRKTAFEDPSIVEKSLPLRHNEFPENTIGILNAESPPFVPGEGEDTLGIETYFPKLCNELFGSIDSIGSIESTPVLDKDIELAVNWKSCDDGLYGFPDTILQSVFGCLE